MNKTLLLHFNAVWLCCALLLCVQSCDDAGVQLEKNKIQFTLSPGTTSAGRVNDITLSENAHLRISVSSNSGTPIYSSHDIPVLKSAEGYITEPLELPAGSYLVTDFLIVEDGEVLKVAPKSKSLLSSFVTQSLPYNFLVGEQGIVKASMQVLHVGNEKPEAFGYKSFKLNTVNKLSFIVSKPKGRQSSFMEATAELRQGKHFIKSFLVKPGLNRVEFEGDPNTMYTLSVYANEAAQIRTFNYKALKKELGTRPLKMTLEPALLLTMESSLDEGNDYEEYFEFALEGTGGAVNVNWGDGHENSYTLPFNAAHEYTTGAYTAIVTGALDQITNLHGFSYSTTIYAIKGLTNLTALKTYNPSWGAVPIKVNLSNCKKLETIHVEKYGAPYEPIDLRTDFKLPEEHFINEFVFHVPSLDPTRENISTEELTIIVDNIYNNAARRNIYGGRFFVYPVDAPSAETRKKLDILQNKYNWKVSFDGNIWEEDSEAGRATHNLDARREKWLRGNFPGSKHLLGSPKMAFTD